MELVNKTYCVISDIVPIDVGTKTASYLVTTYLPLTVSILALHRTVEPPNLAYYFGHSEYASFDLRFEDTIKVYHEVENEVDVVICERDHIPYLESEGAFLEGVRISSEGKAVMWIFTRPHISFPITEARTENYNRLFDRYYAPHVTLLPHRPRGVRPITSSGLGSD